MSDKYTLEISGFRSIRSASVDIAPLTVVYGPNGSGKSSLIYALLTLKNFLTNPNQNLPSLFNYPSISLGGLPEIVSRHEENESISVSMGVRTSDSDLVKFALMMAESGGKSGIYLSNARMQASPVICMEIEIPFPYRGGQQATSTAYHMDNSPDDDAERSLDLVWNGINLGLARSDSDWEEFLVWANQPMEFARTACFVPLKRGFSVPIYNVTSVTPQIANDMEVASLLIEDRYLEYAVSQYMEMVANKQLRTRLQIGTSTFTLDTIPRNGGVPSSIVNDGFGVNQIAYMLTLCLYKKAKIVAIEEPEIHLHPAMVRKLVHAMVDIVANSDKRIIVSTHSESFVLALLTRIITGEIGLDDVSFILADNSDGESVFAKKEAKSNGQIEGGLDSFVAHELEDMAVFLGLDK